MTFPRAVESCCRPQTCLRSLGDGGLGSADILLEGPRCRTGPGFPWHIPELRLAGVYPSRISWSFPKCKIASGEKCGVSGFPEEAGDTGAAIQVFPPGFWQGGRQEHQSRAGGLGAEISSSSPSFSLYLSRTHGWVGSNLNQNSKSPKNRENFSKPESLIFSQLFPLVSVN